MYESLSRVETVEAVADSVFATYVMDPKRAGKLEL